MKIDKQIKSPHTKNTLLQFAQCSRTKQKLQESIFSPTQEKLKNKKSPTLQKNKTSFQRTLQTLADIASIINIFGQSMHKLDTTHLRTDRRASGNRRLAQWRVKWLIEHSTSHQLLWCIDSFVLRNPPLRQAPKPL
jgi:hypothetical protein